MNRKRALLSHSCSVKKTRRFGTDSLIAEPRPGPKPGPLQECDVKATLQYLITLFPCKLFDDRLPPIVLKHQLYSLLNDKTLVDKQLNELRDKGEVLMFHLGFDSESFAVVFAEDYKARVLAAQTERDTCPAVEKFLDKALCGGTGLSFNKEQMLKEFSITDSEITQLIKSGVLTVRDAGSWWLSIPNSGRFTKYFISGRRAVLAMVKKSKYNEILKDELEKRRSRSQVKLKMTYHIHDIIGAELVECIQTTSGTLLRCMDI